MHAASYFKTSPGQYGEGDIFLGVSVPAQRKIAREAKHLSQDQIQELLASPIHEERFTALQILVAQYQKADAARRQEIYDFYLSQTRAINNWDLVDSSAREIVGQHLLVRSRQPLYRLVRSRSLWERRIAILATFAFLRTGDTADSYAIAELLLGDPDDLIHKAVGWMLREAGKTSQPALLHFLETHYTRIPRTTLRYAIEKLPEEQRKRILQAKTRH